MSRIRKFKGHFTFKNGKQVIVRKAMTFLVLLNLHKFGSLTPALAYKECKRCKSLSSRICELRKLGVRIETILNKKRGTKTRIKYVLKEIRS